MATGEKKGIISVQGMMMLVALAWTFCAADLPGKPPYHLYKTRGASYTAPIDEKSDSDWHIPVSDLQNDVENHEVELRMFEERLNTQETILDALRQQMLDSSIANQELFKGSSVSLEKRITAAEGSFTRLSHDMRELQSHANDTAKALSQYKEVISDLESQIAHLNNAVDTLLAALQIEQPKTPEHNKIYEVKPGDRLEKIARAHSTSIKKIKEINQLTNDRIFVGQKLKLP